MMSLLISLIFFFIVILKMNYLCMFMFMQNMILLFFIYFMMKFSLNFFIWVNLYYFIGVDIYSWSLILLSMWIMFLMMLFSNKMLFLKNCVYYMILMVLMIMFLLLCFMSLNLMMFYIWFESSLIPVFLLIMGWGVQPERIQAGFYMMIYTLLGSMPLFFIIIYLYLNKLSLMMDMLLIKKLNLFIYLSLMMGFLIKMPMYLFHLWLPKAHVEAPVMGSMILAGVMLKLGTYGILRTMLFMVNLCMKFNKFFLIIGVIGGLISSLICLFQIDMKMLVAYSSIVHMSVLLGGLMTLNNWGFMGAIFMMLAHGLCSSGLFSLVNMSYERVGSRSLYINKGMLNYFPSLSLMWFFLCSSNLSFPPSFNLFSEIMLISSLIIWLKLVMLILLPLIFLSACYTLYLYSFSQHGKLNYSNYLMMMISVSEYFNLLMHWIPLNILFLMMMIF